MRSLLDSGTWPSAGIQRAAITVRSPQQETVALAKKRDRLFLERARLLVELEEAVDRGLANEEEAPPVTVDMAADDDT